MAKVRADFVYGTLTAAITTSSTTITSAALASLPVVASPDTATLTLYDAATRAYEIVHVTAHTAASTSATVLRARESTTALAWPISATWLHGPSAADWAEVTSGNFDGGAP